MKHLFFLFLFLSLLFGFDLDARLEQIEKLPPNKRYKAMNELKKDLLRLNEKRREELLMKLLKKFRLAPESRTHTPSLP